MSHVAVYISESDPDPKGSTCVSGMFAQSLSTQTRCPRSQGLRGHGVSVVKDYVDTVSALSMTMRTMLTHRKLFYFGKSKKTKKVTTNVI